MTDADSPLTTTSADALTAVFEADPLTLSDAALMSLVTELRRRRNAFLAEEAAKAASAKAPRTRPGTVTAAVAAHLDRPATEIDLNEL